MKKLLACSKVDDDEDIGLLIVQLIQRETSHAVMRHTSGAQALQAIQTRSPHLFILDYLLPDMNGLFLPKPFDLTALLQAIARHLG
ncbi:MAG TPA: response regulator [Ktedonobacteraceae bacterium]|nr:response regulator [Ktedonobacteraceae bacterium]